MKIQTLVENTTCNENLGSAHGLSFYIETENHKILFDMGPEELFWENATKLGIDLKKVDLAFISHGHDDHGGGLRTFLDRNEIAKIYINKMAFGGYHSISSGELEYIGLDKSLKDSNRIIYTDTAVKIDDELTVFSDIVKSELCPTSNITLLEKVGDEMINDKFKHEQSLIIFENNKKVLFGGCAHRGVLNIISRAIEIIGMEPDYLISGFHLMMPNGNKVENFETIDKLSSKLIQYKTKYYTCHCTGIESYNRLKQKLNDQIDYIATGMSLDI